MKTTTLLAALLLLLIVSTKTMAQVSLKTEYFGSSGYIDNDGNKMENGKGSATIYSGNIKIPISVKMSKDSLVSAWMVDIAGTHASLDNKNISQDLVLSNITNLQLSLITIRPLNPKWSLIAFLGAGVYTNETQISRVNGNSILGSGGALFVKKINPKLGLGGGLALTNTLGYPMLFPALYVNYNSEGKYTFRVSMMNGFQAAAGYNFNKKVALHLIAEMNGQLAMLQKEGKNVMFTHQYFVTGLRPELKLNKHISLPITLGVNAMRAVYFNERTLKSLFSDKTTHSKFDFSLYAAAEIKYRF